MPRLLTIVIALLPAAALLGLPGVARADVLEVNELGDHAPAACTNADCTLREAVIAANGLPGDDRVALPSRKSYKLTREIGAGPGEAEEGDLDLDAALGNLITLAHPGAGRATIDATGAGDRAIELVGTATIRRVVLRDGDANSTGEAGGAVSVGGNLTMARSRIRRSQASDVGGGVYITGGRLVLRRSAITSNVANGEGGGIFLDSDAKLDMKKSTIARNEADQGGGVFTTSEVVGNAIVESTVSGNTAMAEGGGVWNGGPSLLIGNSTVADNTADGSGGGLYTAPDSGTMLEFVTVVRNRADADDAGPHGGGGVFADGGDDVVGAQGSLFARNRTTGAAFEDCDAPAPVGIVSSGDNLLTTEQDCPFFDHAEDIVDDEPLIGVLDDNGGPTQTVKLKAGSPAIDAVGLGAPDRDQRGVERGDGAADIGAFERKQ